MSNDYVPPPLPPPSQKMRMRGPTDWCNYVIRGPPGSGIRPVLAGAFPASVDDDETDEILEVLLAVGERRRPATLDAHRAPHAPSGVRKGRRRVTAKIISSSFS